MSILGVEVAIGDRTDLLAVTLPLPSFSLISMSLEFKLSFTIVMVVLTHLLSGHRQEEPLADPLAV